MEINRKVFLSQFFRTGNVPDYACPTCGAHLISEAPVLEDRAETKHRRDGPAFGHDDVASVFHLKLMCTHPKCGEPVFAIGERTVEYESVDTEHGWDEDYVDYLEPKYFMPHLKMFKIPGATPYPVSKAINASFNLFFVSSGSALNEVRNAVEFLMDELGVAKSGLDDKKKMVRWDLDTRVGKLPAKYGRFKQHLLAVKGLGNWGSHAVKTTREDVLDAYQILSYVLDGIYAPRDAHATALAKKVREDKRDKI